MRRVFVYYPIYRRHHDGWQVWDTAGMERFATVNREFYRGADMCVLVYAVDEAASFEKLNFWYDAFVDATGVSPGSGFPFVVLGNKVDLDGAAHVVLEADVTAWCQARGGMPHFLVREEGVPVEQASQTQRFCAPSPLLQVSALTGENVDEAFGLAVKAAIVRRVKEDAEDEPIAAAADTLRLDARGGAGAGDGAPGRGATCAC